MVMSGKDRGKTGKVLRVLPRDQRLSIEGVAMQTRHRRARRSGEKGQRVSIPGMIAIGNVRVMCGSCHKPVRVGYKMTGAEKHRVCRKCGATIS